MSPVKDHGAKELDGEMIVSGVASTGALRFLYSDASVKIKKASM